MSKFRRLPVDEQIERAEGFIGSLVTLDLAPTLIPDHLPPVCHGLLLAVARPVARGRPLLVLADARTTVAITVYWVDAIRDMRQPEGPS